jgi:beta-N-acetylhexosaminidase
VAALPNELKMAQMVMMGVYGDKLTPKLTEEFSANHVGGVIVMTAPTPAKAGEKNALQRFIDAQKIPPLAATDQEGGKPATDIGAVSRFEVPDSVTLGGYMPTATKVASTMTPAAAEKMYTKNFAYLKSQGINMNFGPVADLIPSSGTNELAGRQYSTDPTKASAYVAANVRAADLADILPVVKHFPGNTMNTDIHSATSKNYADLEKSDLLPFKAAGKTNAAIMIGNMIVPNLTAGQPASLSLAANKAARNLGYDFTITDALNAKAINLPAATAVVKAWEAGNNMALIVGPDKGLTLTKQFMAIDAYANKELKNGNLTQAQINTAFAGVIAEKQEAGINITACDLRAALPSNAADAAGAAAKESSTSSTSAPKVTNPVSTPSATEAAKKVSVSTATPTVAAAKN